jgi:hypothetical protein
VRFAGGAEQREGRRWTGEEVAFVFSIFVGVISFLVYLEIKKGKDD